ncbi:MAG: putative lipoprotein [Fibrobacteres bacterium]|nr:putative lipoprotein [Fibrobacterota bacterium]
MGMNSACFERCTPILAVLSLLFLAGCGGDLKRARESYRVGDYPRALRLFESELDKHPGSFEARYGYAVVLQEVSLKKKALGQDDEKDWSEVVRAYEICARLGDSGTISENYAISLFHLANKLYLAEKFDPALEYLETARRVDPKNKYVLNLAGIVQYSLGKYQDAQETFEYLIAEDPGFVSAYLNLGNVLWESGNEDAALVTWKQALTVSPDNQAVIKRIESALQKIAGS